MAPCVRVVKMCNVRQIGLAGFARTPRTTKRKYSRASRHPTLAINVIRRAPSIPTSAPWQCGCACRIPAITASPLGATAIFRTAPVTVTISIARPHFVRFLSARRNTTWAMSHLDRGHAQFGAVTLLFGFPLPRGRGKPSRKPLLEICAAIVFPSLSPYSDFNYVYSIEYHCARCHYCRGDW